MLGGQAKLHPVAYLGVLALISVICGAVILSILTSHPNVLGQAASYRLGASALRFNNLEVELDHLQLTIPQGYMVPVLRTGEVAGVVVIGEGQYVLGWEQPDLLVEATGHEVIKDTFPALFTPIGYAQFENLRYQLGAAEVSALALHPRVHVWLEATSAPASLDFFGSPRRLYLEPAEILFHLMGDSHGQIVYQELPSDRGALVTFSDLANYQIELPPGRGPADNLLSWEATVGASDFWMLLLLTVTLFILFFCLIGILTVDLPGPERISALGPMFQGELVLLAVTAGLLVLLHAFVLPAGTEGVASLPVASWAIPALLGLLVGAMSAGTAPQAEGMSGWRRFTMGLGLWPTSPLRSILLGIILGWLTFLVAYGAVPAVDQFELSAGWWWKLLWAVFTWGLCGQILHHGFFQTGVQRYLGPLRGLIVSAVALGIMAALPVLMADGPTAQFLRQGLLLSPLAALVSGYLLHRTGDIWAGSVAAGFYTFLIFTLIP